MATEPTILHSDLNCFYASVEMMLDPRLRGKAVAVCGATEDRHGIVLAKSELAKRAGVKTGMVNWEAKQRCPDLILVPPQRLSPSKAYAPWSSKPMSRKSKQRLQARDALRHATPTSS